MSAEHTSMSVLEAIQNRRSRRRYEDGDVTHNVLDRVLNAARFAPSACAMEARKFIVVREPAKKREVAETCHSWFPGPHGRYAQQVNLVITAPVIIVACNAVREANMLYFGTKGEDLVTFSNRDRKPGTPRYWDEYLEHSAAHEGEYESLGIWDLAVALDHLSLAAVGEGLGMYWMGTTDEWELRRVLSIPDDVHARMIMLLGYPAEAPSSAQEGRSRIWSATKPTVDREQSTDLPVPLKPEPQGRPRYQAGRHERLRSQNDRAEIHSAICGTLSAESRNRHESVVQTAVSSAREEAREQR